MPLGTERVSVYDHAEALQGCACTAFPPRHRVPADRAAPGSVFFFDRMASNTSQYAATTFLGQEAFLTAGFSQRHTILSWTATHR